MMMAFAAIVPERLAFLSELYTRSAGDARQGVPYEALIDALGFDERVTKRIQRELEREGLVDLTTVPPMTHMGRPVMDHAPRHRRQQTIGICKLQGEVRLAAAEVDAAVERPGRVDQRDAHWRTASTAGVGSARPVHSQSHCISLWTPSSTPTRGRHPVTAAKAPVLET